MNINPDLIKQYVLTAIRWAIVLGFGKLLTKFNVTSEDLGNVLTAIVTIAMFVWSLANKTHFLTKVNTALDLPMGSTSTQLKAVISAGQGVSATAVK